MVSMFGRGFDSRQLHDQAENNHPRQGVFVFLETVKSSLLRGLQKNKKPCAAWWLFYICRTGAQGSPSDQRERGTPAFWRLRDLVTKGENKEMRR